MRRRAALVGSVVAATALMPGIATAQGGNAVSALFGALSAFFLPLAGVHVVSERLIPVRVTGQLTVSFHADPASGCASRGLCEYSGTVVVRPGGTALLTGLTVRAHAKLETVGALALVGTTTAAEVSRSAGSGQAARCADEQQPSSFLALLPVHGIVTLSLIQPDGSLLTTRCAGPLDADLAKVAPYASLPTSFLLKGRISLDFSRSASFAEAGLAGTVRSTIHMTFGPPTRASGLGLPRRLKYKRIRVVTERLSVARLSSTLHGVIRGVADPDVCGSLDSCGATGLLAPSDRAHGALAELTAGGSARLPYRDFLAALRGKRVPGITIEAEIGFVSGTLMESVSLPGASCNDSAPYSGGLVLLTAARKTLATAYGGGPLRTRCPGPFAGGRQLAAGHSPRGILRGQSFTLVLRAAGPSADDGYDANWLGAIRITLRHGRVTQRVIRVPTG